MIKIGTSGFSFPDWKGIVYPPRLANKDMLFYYTHHYKFDTVEINSSYYAIPNPGTMETMSDKTPDNFVFVVKGYKGMTHDPFDHRLEHIPTEDEVKESFQGFNRALQPLKESHKLGAVLLQFPVFFYRNPRNRDYILFCKEQLKDIPVVIEFRNNAWAAHETFEFLRANDLAYCAVDEPKLPRLMPFINEVTSSIGYLRFHGRNQNWFNAPVSERYDYFYSDGELREFVPEVRKMESRAAKVFIFFNNCHVGSALKNALTFKGMVGEEPGGVVSHD
ncbi:MAG: DUF72 domain-containing protein [Nitrospira sp.]|nr:DUF72 domain-containing protein [Nitrospira sp.]